MTITRHGMEASEGTGRPAPCLARAAEADGWLPVSGQISMEGGEVIDGGIMAQVDRANPQAGYGIVAIVRGGVGLDDRRDFWSFDRVFADHFGTCAPARACIRSAMMGDGKVEMDFIACRSTS